MPRSLLECFKTLPVFEKDKLADLSSPLILSLATLDLARSLCLVESLSAEHIVACLEAAGVAVKRFSISRALATAHGLISAKKGIDNEVFYTLMTKGKRKLDAEIGSNSLSVFRIEGGNPRTARTRLAELISSLAGCLKVCDPYYGIRTLETLDYVPKTCGIQFITVKTNEPLHRTQGPFNDFKKERPNFEMRICNNPKNLHDRYILTNNEILLLGHGLKDIGGKESFIIRLGSELVPDILIETRKTFDARWAVATPA